MGIVNHQTYADLALCLDSIKAQSRAPRAIVVVDSDPIEAELAVLQAAHPDVHWRPSRNRGFAGGANAALRAIEATTPDAAFALILNPDVDLDAGFAQHLFAAMCARPEVALATGKLRRPDGNLLDSAGIVLPRNRRPRDRGSEEPDRGQYERTEYVFGASGAALSLRRAALPDLAVEGQVFDEDFFLYHEDTDLAWRANLLGWRVLYVPEAKAIHGRRWRPDLRFDTAETVRRHSFKNHYLQIIKNERPADFVMNLPVVLCWEVIRLGFALVRDPAVLGGYGDALRLSGNAWRKRRLLQARARARRAE